MSDTYPQFVCLISVSDIQVVRILEQVNTFGYESKW